jgi:hypothetical protein
MEICDCFFYCLFISVLSFVNQLLLCGGHRGRDHMVVGFTEDTEKITGLSQVIDKLYHIMLYQVHLA